MRGSIEPVLVPTVLGDLAVHVLGSGRPTVLWHPLFVDGAGWGYLLPRLLADRTLLVVDGPGWGRSARLPPSARPEDVTLAAAQLVRALAEGPVDWVGAGWGGHVGMALAARNPELIRSLVAIGSPPERLPAADRRRLRRTLAGLRVIGPVGGVGRAIIGDRLAPSSRTEPQTVGAVLDALMLAGRIGAARAVTAFELQRPDLTGLLPRITVPALFVAGDADSGWTEQQAAAAAALAPFATVDVVPGTRALAPLDRPEALAATIRAFWTTLETPS